MDNRTMLRTLIRGANRVNRPLCYDLRKYGGFHLIATKSLLLESELREMGRSDYDKTRQELIFFAQSHPSLVEDGDLTPEQYGWVRAVLPEDIRERLDRRFLTDN